MKYLTRRHLIAATAVALPWMTTPRPRSGPRARSGSSCRFRRAG